MTCISTISCAWPLSSAHSCAFSRFLLSNSFSPPAPHPFPPQQPSHTRSAAILPQFSSSSFLHLAIRKPFHFVFQNKSPLDQANRTTSHPVILFRRPLFAAIPARAPPTSRPHFAFGKLVNAPPECSETHPIPRARCTRNPHRADA